MNKKLIIIIVFLLMLLNMNTGQSFTTYTVLTNFESYASGVTNGTESTVEWERTDGDDFEVFDDGGDKVLLLSQGQGTAWLEEGELNQDKGYVNLTDDYYSFELSCIGKKSTQGSTSNMRVTIRGYNQSGGEIIRLQLKVDTNPDALHLYYYDYIDGNTNVIKENLNEDTEYSIRVQSVLEFGNDYNYSVYDSSGTYVDSVLGYSRVSGSDLPSDLNETKISYFYITTADNNYGGTFFLDDFIGSDETAGGVDYFDVGDTVSMCGNPIDGYLNLKDDEYVEYETASPLSSTIHHVLLPIGSDQRSKVSNDVNDYSLYLNDYYINSASYIQEYGSEYAVVFADLNNGAGYTFTDEKLVFSFGCTETVTYGDTYHWYNIGIAFAGNGVSKAHSSNGLFSDGVLSGNNNNLHSSYKIPVCWYYDSGGVSQPEPVPSIELIDQYEDSYAENGSMGWCEFYEWFSDCFHRVGDKPYIIYNLTGNGSGETKIYRLNIIKTGESSDFEYTTLISFAGDYKTAYFRIPDFTFAETGQYYIQIRNTTDYGLTVTDTVYTSRTIYVCEDLSGVTPDSDILPVIEQPLGSIIGFMIVLFSLLTPLFITISLKNQTGASIQLPTFVFAVSGGMGIAVSVALGLFPSWIVFFIIGLGIMSIVLGYVLKLREQGVM